MPDSMSEPAVPGSVPDARSRALRAEVEQIITEAKVGARRAQRRSKLWNATYLCLGFPSAVLAGISGAAGLASAGARVPAAVLALLAAGFSAGATFLRADARQMTNLRRRYAWQNLETRARLVLAYDAYESAEHLRASILALYDLRATVPSSALVVTEMQPPAPFSPAATALPQPLTPTQLPTAPPATPPLPATPVPPAIPQAAGDPADPAA